MKMKSHGVKKLWIVLLAFLFLFGVMEVSAAIPSDAVSWCGHSYKIYKNRMTPQEEQAFCKAQGGYLASITSPEENEFIVSYMNKMGITSNLGFGGTDHGHEGNWTWLSGETWNYSNWDYGEPNNGFYSSDGQDYTHMYPWGTWDDYYGQWDQYTELKDAFICEWGGRIDLSKLSANSFVLGTTKYTYDGNAKCPTVFAYYNGNKSAPLNATYDYTVEYTNNVKAGTAKVVIKGIGRYTGSVTKTFTIQSSCDVSGHKFGSWVVTKKATTSAAGSQKRTCSVCGKVETKSIPKLVSGNDGKSNTKWDKALKNDGILFHNHSKLAVSNKPTKKVTFDVIDDAKITAVWTYHWNVPSTLDMSKQYISIVNAKTNKEVYKGKVQADKGSGRKNVNWYVFPNITLPAGEYIVKDTHAASWSWTKETNKQGMCGVTGYYPDSSKYTYNRTYAVGQKLGIWRDAANAYYPPYFTWTSSDKSVATVNSKGVVTCKKKGTVTITAKNGKSKYIYKVKISDHWEPVGMSGTSTGISMKVTVKKVYKDKIVVEVGNTLSSKLQIYFEYLQFGKKKITFKKKTYTTIPAKGSTTLTLKSPTDFSGKIDLNDVVDGRLQYSIRYKK